MDRKLGSHFSQTCEFCSSEANRRLRFSLLSIILTDLLGNKTLLHGFKRSWFVICGFRSVLCVSLFQGSLLVIVIMIDGTDKHNCEGGFWLCLNHTVQKDSRGVLGMSFRFGPTSEILENIEYGGSSVVGNWQPKEPFYRQRSVILRYCWPSLRLLRPFIRGKIRRVLHKTRTFRINGTFRLK